MDVDGYKIVNVYKPPPTQLRSLDLPVFPHPCLYAGDFNCRHADWGYDDNSPDGECLADWANINCLGLLYNAKNAASFYSDRWNTGSNPDLAFASVGPNSRLPDRRVFEKLPRSQHRPLLITPSKFAMAVPSMSVKRWSFRKAKWSQYIALTNKFANTLLPLDSLDVDANSDIAKSTKTCQTRIEDRRPATLCDGRPECSDLSDECSCENPPEFCNDTCHNDYNIGDRYCDGIEDNFYGITNKSNCFKGFDELNCPKRFVCNAGSRISIDIDQICDGKQNCDDNRDEKDCKYNANSVFSSEQEMIASSALKSCFWIMGILVISGNLYVITSTVLLIQTIKLNKSLIYQNVIILNISIADMIMGIYLLSIAGYSAYYSGYYGQIDFKWRSSLRCSLIGSLAVLSNEASCFFYGFINKLSLVHNP